jgi:cell division protein ZapA
MRTVTVEIMGQNLLVTSDDDDSWVKAIAETVDEKIRFIRTNSRAVNSINVAILAALNFADELERLKREHQELIRQIDALSKRLSDSIDSRK